MHPCRLSCVRVFVCGVVCEGEGMREHRQVQFRNSARARTRGSQAQFTSLLPWVPTTELARTCGRQDFLMRLLSTPVAASGYASWTEHREVESKKTLKRSEQKPGGYRPVA